MTINSRPRRRRTPGPANPLRLHRFRLLWGGHLVSLLGDQIFPIALVAFAIEHGGSTALTISVVFAARFGALALFIVLGGVLADRVDRIRGMIALDVFRALAVGVVALTGSGDPVALLAALAFVLGAGEALFTPLYESTLPDLVPDAILQQANSLSSLIKNLATVAGPAGAGLLVAVVGARWALLLDTLSFGVSALALLRIRQPGHVGAGTADRPSLWHSAMAGARVVLGVRWLAALEGMAIVHTLLAVGPWYVLLPTIAFAQYHSVAAYGFFLAAFGVGGVAGAIGGWRMRSRLRGLIALAGIGTFGLCCLVLGWRVQPAVTAVVFIVGGFGTQMFDVVKTTAIQQSVERGFMGRVMSLDFFATFVPMPIGQVLGGILVSYFAPQEIMRVAGIVVLVTTLLPLLAPQIATFGASIPGTDPRDSNQFAPNAPHEPAVTS